MTANSEPPPSNLPMVCGNLPPLAPRSAPTTTPSSTAAMDASKRAYTAIAELEVSASSSESNDDIEDEQQRQQQQAVKISPPIPLPSSLNRFLASPADYLRSNPDVARLVVGTVVFTSSTASSSSTPTSSSPPAARRQQVTKQEGAQEERRVLLVQRSRHDFMGSLWEVPGGSCDVKSVSAEKEAEEEEVLVEEEDPSILAAACRELYEEAGLLADRFVGVEHAGFCVGSGSSGSGSGSESRSASSSEDEGQQQADQRKGGGGQKMGGGSGSGALDEKHEWMDSGKKWRKLSFIVEVESMITTTAATTTATQTETERTSPPSSSPLTITPPKVTLDPEEHEDFVWATEAEVRDGFCEGRQLIWTSKRQRRTILKGFEYLGFISSGSSSDSGS